MVLGHAEYICQNRTDCIRTKSLENVMLSKKLYY